jgi:hypothetical protein
MDDFVEAAFTFPEGTRPDALALVRVYLLNIPELRCVPPITQRNLPVTPKPPTGRTKVSWFGTSDIGGLPVIYMEKVCTNRVI